MQSTGEAERAVHTVRNLLKKAADPYCAKPLCDLSPCEHMWVTDAKTPGTVVQSHSTPRCCAVVLPQGTVRRNRLHLIPLHSPSHEKSNKQQCV